MTFFRNSTQILILIHHKLFANYPYLSRLTPLFLLLHTTFSFLRNNLLLQKSLHISVHHCRLCTSLYIKTIPDVGLYSLIFWLRRWTGEQCLHYLAGLTLFP